MLYYERKLAKQGVDTIIGVDEAGRGPLAGPVVAGAVVLPPQRYTCRVDDSKKLSAKQRYNAFLEIIGTSSFGIGIVDQETIDRVNILVASRIAMERAVGSLVRKLQIAPCLSTGAGLFSSSRAHVLADGNMRLGIVLPYTSIIKGDARSKSIAAGSIVAKVIRDSIMLLYDRRYPQYGFSRHQGYSTREHRARLREFGLSPVHRKSFCTGILNI